METQNLRVNPINTIFFVERLRGAPRLIVNTPVKDIEIQEVSIYEMLDEIETGGTCTVHVPDIKLLLALDRFSRTDLRFRETCLPTYLCSDVKEHQELLARARETERYRYWLRPNDIGAHKMYAFPDMPRMPRELLPWMKVKECTTIGSPYTVVAWDYYIYYPPGLSVEELATLLHEKRLKFIKVLPKIEPIENPCKC